MRRLCKENTADSCGSGFLRPLLRWGSVHVLHRESKSPEKIFADFRLWATAIGFDAIAIAPFEKMLVPLRFETSASHIQAHITSFEFATDGYNLFASVCLSDLSNDDQASERSADFLRQFALNHSSLQTTTLIGQAASEMVIGLMHARLPTRSSNSKSVWILAETPNPLLDYASQPLKEVG